MATIFSKIISGEVPAHKVAETNDYLAFLDINPLKRGHVLCIPKKEVDYLFDLDDDTYLGLHLFAKHVAIALKKTVSCQRVGTAVIGMEVPHAHIHLVPMDEMHDLNFQNDRVEMSEDELATLAGEIRRNI